MSTTIIDFWSANPSFWITHSSKQERVDEVIYSKFWNYDWNLENLIGQVIYLDQFSRHFARLNLISEIIVETNRSKAITLVNNNIHSLLNFNEIEIIFALMPFKHLKKYDFIFEYLHNIWLPAKDESSNINNFPRLQKFYIDTYKKAFTLETVTKNIITKHESIPYDSSLICDYYPEKYTDSSWPLTDSANIGSANIGSANIGSANIDSANIGSANISSVRDNSVNKLLPLLKTDRKVIVSLSGGVDSMVMLYLLKYSRANVSAVHIVYGNRKESDYEYQFLAEFCNKLRVPLSVYKIKWLKRGYIDREFYEDMTRDLRFFTYHASNSILSNSLDKVAPCVIMGHIKDDVIENIWTNIAHCHHLDNLKKMESEELQSGVCIIRPFLNVDKKDIYNVSKVIGIPYLKNTTPNWSNRGKFRNTFHNAVVTQFGTSIDTKIIEFANSIQAQNRLLNTLLYEPIYNSFSNNTLDITIAVNAQLDANNWLIIFEHLCHKFLKCTRPSIKNIQHFCLRLYKSWDNTLNVDMGKNLKISILKINNFQYTMKILPSV